MCREIKHAVVSVIFIRADITFFQKQIDDFAFFCLQCFRKYDLDQQFTFLRFVSFQKFFDFLFLVISNIRCHAYELLFEGVTEAEYCNDDCKQNQECNHSYGYLYDQTFMFFEKEERILWRRFFLQRYLCFGKLISQTFAGSNQ